MQENHQREQYFFAPPTVQRLTDLMMDARAPCCLCAPMIARELAARGRSARLLDIDERFSVTPGFRRWDLYRPEPVGETFDRILCDPPFTKVRLSQLFDALRVVCQGDFSTPILLCHLAQRAGDVTGALARFGLQPTDIEVQYVSIKPTAYNRVILYTNAALVGTHD